MAFKLDPEESLNCLLCFKDVNIYSDLQFENLSIADEYNKTYLDKIQFIMNCDVVIYECTHICNCCKEELDQAYQFRIKLETSLQYWSTKYNLKEELKESDKFIIIGLDDESNCDSLENKDEIDLPDKIICDYQVENETCNKKDAFEAMSTFECYRCKVVFETAAELLHHQCCPIKQDKLKNSKTKLKKTSIKLTVPQLKAKFIKPRKYVCNICNEAFKQSHHLLEHSTKHTGERNFSCNFCEKTFQRYSSVSRHMKSHDALPGQKAKKSPFLCTICGKNFPYSNAIQRHMRMHKGIRPHQCQICNKKFSQMAHLKVHMRTHTGEKPYICDECGAAFKFNQTLQRHLSKHEQGDVLEIPRYNVKFYS